ncbi:MAG: putative membrane protein [Loktanella salsilacus]|jgi:putative membrane protein|uniref:YidH family protein n=1 Tax=Loktanella salsilacus TaxID=195913 RepID=UPI003989F6A9
MPSTELPNNPDANDLADTRTAWAEDRTVLANERTFAGWMRTGMACIALALGLKAVFKDTDHLMLAKGVAEIFIVVAILIFWSAAQKCRQAQSRMKDHDVEAQPHKRMTWLAAILTVGAFATGVILWLL